MVVLPPFIAALWARLRTRQGQGEPAPRSSRAPRAGTRAPLASRGASWLIRLTRPSCRPGERWQNGLASRLPLCDEVSAAWMIWRRLRAARVWAKSRAIVRLPRRPVMRRFLRDRRLCAGQLIHAASSAQRLARNAIAVAIQLGKPARRQVMPGFLTRRHLAAVSLRAAGGRGALHGRGFSRLLAAVTPFPRRHPLGFRQRPQAASRLPRLNFHIGITRSVRRCPTQSPPISPQRIASGCQMARAARARTHRPMPGR